ncbi:hypothetical protein GCM10023096_51770 [Nonomuraea ferruginea]
MARRVPVLSRGYPTYLWQHGHPYAEKRIEGSGEAVALVSLDPRETGRRVHGAAQGEGGGAGP